MRFVVTCPECIGRITDYPDKDGADGLVRRHHMLVGHDAQVEQVLDTPLEGLVS